jgi:PAS domain S-box-containing protein
MERKISDDITSTTADIDDAEDRALVVSVLAVAVGLIAASFVVWLALRNRGLAARLAADRRRVDDLVASVPGIVWEAWGRPDAASQRIDFVSDYIEEMLGYSVEEWLETPNFWLTIVHPDDKERAAAEAAAIFASGRRGESQFRWICKDGRALEVLAYSTVVRDGSGVPAGMRGITFDITERVRAERQLRFTAQAGAVLLASLDAEQTLHAVAQLAVPDVADWCAVHLVSQSGDIEQVVIAHRDPNKADWARELQERYPPTAGADRGPSHVIATGEPEITSLISDELLARAATDHDQLRLMRDVGIRSYICVPMITRGRTIGAVTLIMSDSGRAYTEADLAFARDLGARAALAIDNAQLHADVERERARFSSMVESTSFAVCQVDHLGRIEHVNPAAERLLGKRGEELLGEPVHAVVHPHHADGAVPDESCQMHGVGQSGRRRTTVTDRFVRSDGSLVDVEVSSAPIIVAGGFVAGAVLVLQDVTERLRQEKMKDDFIGFASHELRSPLTTINGMAKWLVRDVAQHGDRFTEDEVEAATALAEGADRMRGIVELFLDLTRIDAGRFEMEPQEVNFGAILAEETETLARRNPRAIVELHAPQAAIHGWSDPHRIRQVLVNLLDNAVKYGGDPPRVVASIESDGRRVAFCVRDNGEGIAEDDRPHVFDRFYKGTGVKGKGLGIGLFVSREIVQRLGGTLTLETGGAGTEFTMSVPLEMSGAGHYGNGASERERRAATDTPAARATEEVPAPREQVRPD